MVSILFYRRNEEARQILLSTGDATLVEHTANDSYWADGGDGTGLNRLGELLTQVRNGMPEYKPVFFLPQWLQHPGVHPVDMFWRMGPGEDYVMHLAQWYCGLAEAAKVEWRRYYPPPPEWTGFED